MARVSALTQDGRSCQNQTKRSVWYVIGLLSVANMFNYMDRMALSVLMPSIKSDLALSDGQLGLLTGMAFFIFYAVCGIPIARWADRGNRRNIIALALATWSAMTCLSGAAQNFWHLLVARIGVGAGEAGGLSPAQSILCDYVPLRKRSGIFALHNFGLVTGMMLGMVLAGWLGVLIGWRWTFVALGLPGIALALVVRFTLSEPVRGMADGIPSTEPSPPLTDAIGTLWQCRTYRLLVLYAVVNGFFQFGVSQWWPSFYMRVFRLDMASAGLNLGFAIGIGSGLGMLSGGWLANAVARRDVRLPLFVGAGAIILALPTVLAALFVSSVLGSLVLACLTWLLWSLPTGAIVASAYSVLAPQTRATGGAVSVFLSSVLGFGLGPYCVGALSDLLTPLYGNEALRYALLVPVCALPLMATVLYAAANQLPRDLAAARGPILSGVS